MEVANIFGIEPIEERPVHPCMKQAARDTDPKSPCAHGESRVRPGRSGGADTGVRDRGQGPNAGITASRRRVLAMAGGGLLAGPALVGSAGVARADPYGGWFDDVENYEGTIDRRGEDAVRVLVGADTGLLYDPPAVLVDPGTTVTWEWTGEGGQHDVNATEGPAALGSELLDSPGHEYEFTFETDHEGITRYVCTPHEAVGMKGVVAVGDGVIPEDAVVGGQNGDPGGGAPAEPAGTGTLPRDPLDQAAVVLGAAIGGVLLALPIVFSHRNAKR